MKKTLLRKIFSLIKPYSPLMVFSLLCALVTIAMQLYGPILSGRAIDFIVERENVNIPAVTHTIIQFIIVILVAIVAQWIMGMINNKVVFRIVRDLRVAAYNKINTLPVEVNKIELESSVLPFEAALREIHEEIANSSQKLLAYKEETEDGIEWIPIIGDIIVKVK